MLPSQPERGGPMSVIIRFLRGNPRQGGYSRRELQAAVGLEKIDPRKWAELDAAGVTKAGRGNLHDPFTYFFAAALMEADEIPVGSPTGPSEIPMGLHPQVAAAKAAETAQRVQEEERERERELHQEQEQAQKKLAEAEEEAGAEKEEEEEQQEEMDEEENEPEEDIAATQPLDASFATVNGSVDGSTYYSPEAEGARSAARSPGRRRRSQPMAAEGNGAAAAAVAPAAAAAAAAPKSAAAAAAAANMQIVDGPVIINVDPALMDTEDGYKAVWALVRNAPRKPTVIIFSDAAADKGDKRSTTPPIEQATASH